MLADCPGTVNIAEDIVVHGRTTEEHDRRLLKVLERLHEREPTLNSKKCNFRMPRVEFMGFLLSVHGISPTAEKARAVTNGAATEERRKPIISPAETRQHKFAIRERTFIHGRHARRAGHCSSSRPQGSISRRSRTHRHPTATEG